MVIIRKVMISVHGTDCNCSSGGLYNLAKPLFLLALYEDQYIMATNRILLNCSSCANERTWRFFLNIHIGKAKP
jgi:hypothetical protein